MDQCSQQKESENCPCLNATCDNHGRCSECIKIHRQKGSLVYCMKQIAK